MIVRDLLVSLPLWTPVIIFAYWVIQGCPHADDEE